ncbi:hypothetical protein ACH41H_45585 [Streptomyces sp. NPDC020800]|uniref:hypothetical protein n=1 Tax=Streptomyces sp. NPDC020800 TaxID=3365092 RepID=UPI0037A95E1F
MSNSTRVAPSTNSVGATPTAGVTSGEVQEKGSTSPEKAEDKGRWFASAAVRGTFSGAARSVADWAIRVLSN